MMENKKKEHLIFFRQKNVGNLRKIIQKIKRLHETVAGVLHIQFRQKIKTKKESNCYTK